jgi:hypothetical protein
MPNRFVSYSVLFFALAGIALAQTRSTTTDVQLKAFVAPSAKITAGNPQSSADSAGFVTHQTGDDRLEIVAKILPSANATLIRVPVRIRTNVQSYLLRVFSLDSDLSGSIRSAGQTPLTTREYPLAVNRVFAMGSKAASTSGEYSSIEMTFSPSDDQRHIRIEIQAVPTS